LFLYDESPTLPNAEGVKQEEFTEFITDTSGVFTYPEVNLKKPLFF